ncbi:MAG: hypothetical protein LQ350_007981 [Teloschistes chrysophthalmus]|nr:MAG: hypothetical protein LQ350_007981 [Niorma chrysophthalma]
MATNFSASLDQTFKYPSSDPQCLIKWTRLGSPDQHPVVLIHGTPWSSRLWVPYAVALSRQYSVYIFDNPGYGQSKHLTPAATAEFAKNGSLSQQAEATAALLTHWGFASDGAQSLAAPHVIAHDNAGLVSLRMALQYGCIYKSLTLIDVVAVGPWGLPFFKLVAENPDVFKAIPPQMFDGITRGYIRNAAHKPLRKEDEDLLAEPWVSGDGRPGQEGLVRVLQQASVRKSDDVERMYHDLGENGLPIRIIWAKDDKWLPCDTAEKLKELIGGKCEVVLIEEAGHLIQLDQPERLMAEIVLFLGEVDRVS